MGENEAPAHPKASNSPHVSPCFSFCRPRPVTRGKAVTLPLPWRCIIPDSQLDGGSSCRMVVDLQMRNSCPANYNNKRKVIASSSNDNQVRLIISSTYIESPHTCACRLPRRSLLFAPVSPRTKADEFAAISYGWQPTWKVNSWSQYSGDFLSFLINNSTFGIYSFH